MNSNPGVILSHDRQRIHPFHFVSASSLDANYWFGIMVQCYKPKLSYFTPNETMAQEGSRRLKKAQEGSRRLKKAQEGSRRLKNKPVSVTPFCNWHMLIII